MGASSFAESMKDIKSMNHLNEFVKKQASDQIQISNSEKDQESVIPQEEGNLPKGSEEGNLPKGSVEGVLPEGSVEGILPEGSVEGILPEGRIEKNVVNNRENPISSKNVSELRK